MKPKIEAGKFYRTREGLKVGPMVFGRLIYTSPDGITFRWSDDPNENSVWADNGCYFGNSERARGHDLIEEWADEPEALDLTAITTPDYNDGNWHGWNGEECPDSIHPASLVEFVWHSFNANKAGLSRNDARAIMWAQVIRFRVVKPYTEPREWWIVGDCEAYDSEADAFDACKSLVGNPTPVHVREVKE